MKKDFLRFYVLVFGAFAFFSSVKCMYELINCVLDFSDELIILLVIAIHIGSLLLIFSGRLKK